MRSTSAENQVFAHGQRRTEAGLAIFHHHKAALPIETDGKWISDHMQSCRAFGLSNGTDAIDQCTAYSSTPASGLDKKTVQFCAAVVARQDNCEPDDSPIVFGNKDSTSRDLFNRKMNAVWICEQLLTVITILERRPKLQTLERASFALVCSANDDGAIHLIAMDAQKSKSDPHDLRAPFTQSAPFSWNSCEVTVPETNLSDTGELHGEALNELRERAAAATR